MNHHEDDASGFASRFRPRKHVAGLVVVLLGGLAFATFLIV